MITCSPVIMEIQFISIFNQLTETKEKVMSKSRDTQKTVKKKPEKTLKEKRLEKKAKKTKKD